MQLTQSCTVNDPTRPAGRVGFGKLDPRATLADLQQRLPWITIKKSKELPDRTVSRAVTLKGGPERPAQLIEGDPTHACTV